MKCPKCPGRTEVEATRYGDTRARRCTVCKYRFLTLETFVKALPPPKEKKK